MGRKIYEGRTRLRTKKNWGRELLIVNLLVPEAIHKNGKREEMKCLQRKRSKEMEKKGKRHCDTEGKQRAVSSPCERSRGKTRNRRDKERRCWAGRPIRDQRDQTRARRIKKRESIVLHRSRSGDLERRRGGGVGNLGRDYRAFFFLSLATST